MSWLIQPNWFGICCCNLLLSHFFLFYLLCFVSHPGIFIQNSTLSPNTFSSVNVNARKCLKKYPGPFYLVSCAILLRESAMIIKELHSPMLSHNLQIDIFNIKSFYCQLLLIFFPLPAHREDEIKGLPFSKCLNYSSFNFR